MLFLDISFLLLASYVLDVEAESDCGPAPIYVDIHQRGVNGTSEFVYGSFIGIGNPHQNQSLWPSLVHNETYIAADDFCDGIDVEVCNATITGGMIIVADDTLFEQVADYKSTDLSTNADSSLLSGTDTLHLYEHYFESDGAWESEVPNSPVLILQNGTFNTTIHDRDHPGGRVGLGSDSTLLRTLYEGNMTASNSYSLYVGTGYPRAGGDINGSLTLGGYDASRFSGDVSAYDLATNSADGNAFQIGVQQMTLNGLDIAGSEVSVNLIDQDTDLTASLTTEQYPLTLPQTIQERIITLLRASPVNDSDVLGLPSPFKGNLTITLSSGLSITLPSASFSNISSDLTYSTPFASSASASNTSALFGNAFLSYTYLMVSSPRFYLAPAILEAPFISTTTWCANTTPQTYDTLVHQASKSERDGIIGAIIGGTIGGAAVIVVLFCLLRQLLRARQCTDHEPREVKRNKRVVRFLPLNIKDKNGRLEAVEPETPGLQVFPGDSKRTTAVNKETGNGEWYFEPPPRDPKLGKGKRPRKDSGNGQGTFVVGRFGKRHDTAVSVKEIGTAS